MYSKDKVRRTLISEAISEDGLFLRDMAQKLGISESSLRRELDSMVSFGVLEKRGKEYSVSGDIATVIIKARCDRGEVIAYSQEEKLILRESVAYSEAQTYESNLLTLCKAADRYKRFLQKKYKNVMCGVIYPSKKGAPYAVRGLFSLCLEERALICQGLEDKIDGSVLYLSESSFICAQGNAVCDVNISGDIAESLRMVLEYINPEHIFADSIAFGDRLDDIEQACKEKAIECVAPKSILTVDEKEMLTELIFKAFS